MDHLVTTERIDGKGSRGREREKMLDSMTSLLHKENSIQTLSYTWNNEGWRSMVVNAMQQGTI